MIRTIDMAFFLILFLFEETGTGSLPTPVRDPTLLWNLTYRQMTLHSSSGDVIWQM